MSGSFHFSFFDFLIKVQGMRRNLDLRVPSIKEISWPENQRVHIVLKASKSAGGQGDVPKICEFVHPLHLC